MSYELITKFDSKNFTPAASVPATYGRQRTIDSITIHWWGLPEWNATFFGTVDFLCMNKKPTSAHEVIEAGRVAVIVNHGDASWAAGNAVGNATSIHLELNPRASDADYATAAERIRDIRAMHGKDLPLIPHRTWQATMCPGDYDLARLDRMARGSTIAAQGTTTQVREDEDMAVSDDDLRKIYDAVWFGAPGAKLIPNEANGGGEWPYTTLGSLTARISRDVIRPQLADLKGSISGQTPVSASDVADAVIDAVGADLAAQVVTALGQKLGGK